MTPAHEPHPLASLLDASSVALIGASARPQSYGAALLSGALRSDGPELRLINPHHERIGGLPCYRRITDLERPPDLAVYCAPWRAIDETLTQIAEVGTRVVLALSTPPSAGHGIQAAKRAQRLGLRLIGPDSIGLYRPASGLALGLCAQPPEPGRVALLTQSGAVLETLLDWSARREIGLSFALALGLKADVGQAEILDLLCTDRKTSAVMLHLSEIEASEAWYSAIRTLATRKPLFVLRPRRTLKHNAGVADPVEFERLLSRLGALTVRDLPELFASTGAVMADWNPSGDRLRILSNSTALAELALDAGVTEAAQIVEPPTILERRVDAETLIGRLRQAQSRTDADALMLIYQPDAAAHRETVVAELAERAAQSPQLLLVWAGGDPQRSRVQLAQRGLPVYATPEAAIRGYMRFVRWRELRASVRQTPLPHPPDHLPNHPLAADLLARRGADAIVDACAAYGVRLLPPTAVPISDARFGIHYESDPVYGVRLKLSHRRRVARELLPLDLRLVQDLVRRVGVTDATVEALLIDGLFRLSALVECQRQIELLSLTRCAIGLGGLIATRVRAQVGSSARRDGPFAAYPWALEQPLTIDPLGPSLIRPIRGEDEAALRLGFLQLSPEEVRQRFLYPLKALTHDLAAELTQIDYRRQMALVLADRKPAGHSQIYGVVRAADDSGLSSAEFAIVLPSVLSGQGLGTLLMRKLIDHQRARGLRRLWGQVLAENSAMLALARKLNFSDRAHPDEPHLRLIELAL